MSDFFDYSTGRLTPGTIARSTAVNTILDKIDTGLNKLPTEAEIKQGRVQYGTDAGAVNAYVVTLPYTPTALTDGMVVVFKPDYTNTSTAVTLNAGIGGVKTVVYQDGITAPAIGDIKAGYFTSVRYNSTSDRYEIQNVTHGLVGLIAAVGALSAGAGLIISSNDTTVGTFIAKVLAGEGIKLTENNDGGNETVTVDIDDDYAFFCSMAF